MMTATGAEKENHARQAIDTNIRKKHTITVLDPATGQESSYHIVLEDSPIWYVWDETRPIRIALVKRHVYDRSNPTADDILQRPLRDFFVVPDGCYRPWDLHPLSLVKNGKCAVTMIHECYTTRAKGLPIFEEGRKTIKYGWCDTLTEPEIETEWMSYSLNWVTRPASSPSRKDGEKTVSTTK